MEECTELIYDRFRIELFPESAISCGVNPFLKSKVMPKSSMQVDRSQLYLEVGSFHHHTATQIATNDTALKVNSKLSEKREGDYYKVKISFEFINPNPNSLSLCTSIDYKPYHVFVNYLGVGGEVISSRYIYNSLAQSSTSVTENQGLVSVEIEIANVNGIQLLS